MIPFNDNHYKKTKNGGLYLRYSEIENITETLLNDYRPDLLSNPGAIKYDDFLENYLGADLQYQYLYSSSDEGDILGCSVFSSQRIAVFDKDTMTKEFISCPAGSVILDMSLIDGTRQIQENITGLHEGGHIYLHDYWFSDYKGQRSLNFSQGIKCCRQTDINYFQTLGLTTDDYWREWQATIFAVTIALPRKSLAISLPEIFRKNNIDDKQLVIDANSDNRYLAEHVIPETVGKIYNMSKECVRYRLIETGYFINKQRFEQEHAQMTLFDFI